MKCEEDTRVCETSGDHPKSIEKPQVRVKSFDLRFVVPQCHAQGHARHRLLTPPLFFLFPAWSGVHRAERHKTVEKMSVMAGLLLGSHFKQLASE